MKIDPRSGLCMALGWVGMTALVACPGTPPSPAQAASGHTTRIEASTPELDAAIAPAIAPELDASSSTSLDATTSFDASEHVLGEVVCHLFDGCDGSPSCPAPIVCLNCFRQTGNVEECSELFIRQACESRGRGRSDAVYNRVIRECMRVYRTPSRWPVP